MVVFHLLLCFILYSLSLNIITDCKLTSSNPHNIPNKAPATKENAIKHLIRYGYLSGKKPKTIPNAPSQDYASLYSKNEIENALRDYQQFMNIPVTSTLDKKTLKSMTNSRCGIKDRNHMPANIKMLLTSRGKRKKRGLTNNNNKIGGRREFWCPINPTPKIAVMDSIYHQMEYAFSMWTSVTNLVFILDNNKKYIDILIEFYKVFSSWSSWSDCNISRGTGVRKRQRKYSHENECPGNNIKLKRCIRVERDNPTDDLDWVEFVVSCTIAFLVVITVGSKCGRKTRKRFKRKYKHYTVPKSTVLSRSRGNSRRNCDYTNAHAQIVADDDNEVWYAAVEKQDENDDEMEVQWHPQSSSREDGNKNDINVVPYKVTDIISSTSVHVQMKNVTTSGIAQQIDKGNTEILNSAAIQKKHDDDANFDGSEEKLENVKADENSSAKNSEDNINIATRSAYENVSTSDVNLDGSAEKSGNSDEHTSDQSTHSLSHKPSSGGWKLFRRRG